MRHQPDTNSYIPLESKDEEPFPKTLTVHNWQAANATDSRSVCPALNSMANHGYLPRNGQGLTFPMLFHAVSSCYNLTYPLSIILALGAYLLVGFWPLTLSGWTKITLHDICRKMGPSFHDRSDAKGVFLRYIAVGIEHDSSMFHANVPAGQDHLQPYLPSSDLVHRFMPFSTHVTEMDIAHERVRRESEPDGGPLDHLHEELARGELALVYSIWAVDEKLDRQLVVDWVMKEMLPEGKLATRTGLLDVGKRSLRIYKEMVRIRGKTVAVGSA